MKSLQDLVNSCKTQITQRENNSSVSSELEAKIKDLIVGIAEEKNKFIRARKNTSTKPLSASTPGLEFDVEKPETNDDDDDFSQQETDFHNSMLVKMILFRYKY